MSYENYKQAKTESDVYKMPQVNNIAKFAKLILKKQLVVIFVFFGKWLNNFKQTLPKVTPKSYTKTQCAILLNS